MVVNRSTEQIDYIAALRNGDVHIVAFAEEGFSFFKAYCEFAFGFSIVEAVSFCDRINRSDETGTLAPRGNLTAIPKRVFRNKIWDEKGFRRCLRDAFLANKNYCKSQHLVFLFNCVELNRDRLFAEVQRFAKGEFADSGLEKITVHFDDD